MTTYVSRKGQLVDKATGDPITFPDGNEVCAPIVMGDIKPFVSPIDGKEIGSRSALRRHEITHNVRQCGDLKPGENVARAKREWQSVTSADKGADFKWY